MVLHTYKNAFLMIKKSADMIERDEADISIVKQRVSTIDNIAENALYTITAHMEMIKQIDTDFQKFNIEVETCRAIKKVLINKSAEVEFISSMNDKCINSDPFYFSEIVYNIFLNAVEAVEGVKDPKIMVKLTEEKNWFLLEIRDNGRGIEKHKIKDIFMPLYSEKCGPNNWGIGLYYVRKIVRALSGYLFVESKPGDYTVFRVYLPKNIEKERRFFVWN